MNIKRLLALLLCGLLLTGLCACTKTDPAPVDPPVEPVDPAPVDPAPVEPADPVPQGPQPVALTDETREETVNDEAGNPLLDISLTVPRPENMAEAQQYYEDWLNDAVYYCKQDQESAAVLRAEQTAAGSEFFPYAYEATYEVLRNDGVLLSVYRTYYTNTGGVHPNVIVMAETFVTETGALLVLDDLFTVPESEYLPRLMDAVKAGMDALTADYGEDPYFEGARDTLTETFDRRSFALTDDSLRIFFQTYDLAPYAAGIQEFSIPLTELSDILDPAWNS